MSPSLELMAKYLVHQQFYSEQDDAIVSRDKQVQVHPEEEKGVPMAGFHFPPLLHQGRVFNGALGHLLGFSFQPEGQDMNCLKDTEAPNPDQQGWRREEGMVVWIRSNPFKSEVFMGSASDTRWQAVSPALLSVLLLIGFCAPAQAQVGSEGGPQADPADVASVDAIVAAVYDVISGPAGEARDWDRWRSLFLPEARLISLGRNREGGNSYRVLTPQDYVEMAGTSLEENGFFETEIGRTQEEFGPVVHLFSAYQSKRTLDDPEPFARGINSFQLMNDGERWWVLTIYWTSERPDLPIPERYIR